MKIKNVKSNLLKSAVGREFLLGWRLAWLYVARGRKWTLLLTIFLMSVAFINLVFVSSLLGGINQKIESQVKDLMVGEVYLTSKDHGESIKNPNQIIDQIKQIDGVKSVGQNLLVYGELVADENSIQAPIKVIDPEKYAQALGVKQFMTEGEFLTAEDQIVVGRQLIASGENKHLIDSLEETKVGDQITLKINGKEFPVKVAGQFATKFINADSEAYISRATWQKIVSQVQDDYDESERKLQKDSKLPSDVKRLLPPSVSEAVDKNIAKQSDEILKKQKELVDLFPKGDAVSLIAIRTDKPKANQVMRSIKDKDFAGIEVHDWEDSAGYMKSISGSFLAIDAIMLVVGVFIASVTIFIVVYVDIINKRRQIGIQRAIGVKPRIIVFSYVLLSLFYAFCGVVLGAGLFFAALVPYFLSYPLSLPIADVNLFIGVDQLILRMHILLIVALISGIIPAIMASRMPVLEAILGRG